MLSLKLVLVAVIFTALGVKASLPLATTHLPLIWNFFLLCFTPPYLYFTVNAIIISILASSRFHHSSAQPIELIPPPVLEVKAIIVNGEEEEEEEEETKEIDPGMTLKRIDSPEIPPEYLPSIDKPLVSARFTHRKPLKSTPDEGGRALRVAAAKAKRHETLENTWKAITEGRSIPLSRHMKKCDTWQNRGDRGPQEMEPTTLTVREAENETINFKAAAAAVRLRKEPSLSQDELNRRVEAFIRKFNQQMKLQREESLNQYMQMINRGAS